MSERDLYNPIKEFMKQKLCLCGYEDIYVEITADGRISNKVQNKFSHQFTVLEKRFFPDLIALYKKNKREKAISIEVKDDPLTVRDIFQALSYGIILKSEKAFLISPYSLSPQITCFLDDRPDILKYHVNRRLYIGRIHRNVLSDGGWYPYNPF